MCRGRRMTGALCRSNGLLGEWPQTAFCEASLTGSEWIVPLGNWPHTAFASPSDSPVDHTGGRRIRRPPVWRVDRNRANGLNQKNSASAAGLGTVQDRGSQLPSCCEFSGILRPCNRRIHRLVLLGAAIGLQPDRCAPVSILPGTEQPRSLNHQRARGRRPPACVRGR